MFKTSIKVFLVLSLLTSYNAHADMGRDKPQVQILKTTGRVDSKKTPNLWTVISKYIKHAHSYQCSKLKPMHRFFSKMHTYEETRYNRVVPREGVVGYKVWYDLKEGKGKFSAEREWDYKVIFCDWDR